jgi:hypothetical protein
VSAGKKRARNFPSLGWPASNALGFANIGPKPPARSYAHQSRSSPRAMSSGALMFKSRRMLSMPLWMTHMLSDQKTKKHTSCGRLMPMSGSLAIASHPGT